MRRLYALTPVCFAERSPTLGELFVPHLQRSNEGLLRDAHVPIFPHLGFALLLLVQQLALPHRIPLDAPINAHILCA